MRLAPPVVPTAEDTEPTLPVVECFGPTLQGEGPAAGRRAWFLRLAGCNLSCTWCDSPYTWDRNRYDVPAETTHQQPGEIVDQLAATGCRVSDLVVITGGEPLLQQYRPGWRDTLDRLRDRRVHIETNGTLAPDPYTVAAAETIIVSPKLGNAGPHRGRQHPALHPTWSTVPTAHLKVVCEDEEDVRRAVQLADQHGIDRHRVWVMPEGTTTELLAARWPIIAAAAAQRGVNATHRLHVLAWGDRRGH